MGNTVDTVVIGNVTFNKSEVKSSRKIDEGAICMSGQLYEVVTTSGTYRFRDWQNSIHDANVTPTITNGQVRNCNLESIKGTENSDIYSIFNSFVDTIDVAGDGKCDEVHLIDSQVEHLKIDAEKDIGTSKRGKIMNIEG